MCGLLESKTKKKSDEHEEQAASRKKAKSRERDGSPSSNSCCRVGRQNASDDGLFGQEFSVLEDLQQPPVCLDTGDGVTFKPREIVRRLDKDGTGL